MDNKLEQIIKKDDKKFKEILGVKKDTFIKMLELLEKAYIILHSKGGSKPKLSILDKLIITLRGYYREYRTMDSIAFDYNVSKSTIWESIKWVENVLIKSKEFKLPSKKVLMEENPDIEFVIVDVTESPIERPKKNKRDGIQERKNNIQ